jgi:hypothetical protein
MPMPADFFILASDIRRDEAIRAQALCQAVGPPPQLVVKIQRIQKHAEEMQRARQDVGRLQS